MTASAHGVARTELLAYLDQLLEAKLGDDYCPNGLQVEGCDTISRLVTGVSACRELFISARQRNADAILVHHGLFWYGAPLPLVGVQLGRIRELIEADLNLFAYHLPLDRHPLYGNNAVAARAYRLIDLEPFAHHKGLPTGFSGRFPDPVSMDELTRRTAEIFSQQPLVYPEGPQRIEKIALVSGGGQKDFNAAIETGHDAFITGEVTEWVMNLAREARVHYLAAGHYATERLGVRALGEHLLKHFGLEVEFIDIPNPA